MGARSEIFDLVEPNFVSPPLKQTLSARFGVKTVFFYFSSHIDVKFLHSRADKRHRQAQAGVDRGRQEGSRDRHAHQAVHVFAGREATKAA